MKLKYQIAALIACIFSGSSNASCISDEMKKQATNMEAYTPPEFWEVLADTDVPAKLKVLASSKEGWEKIEQESKQFADKVDKVDNEIRTEADRQIVITELEKLLSPEKENGQIMGIWQMLIMQAALRCLKSGESP